MELPRSSVKTYLFVCLAFLLFYTAIMVFQCGNDAFCVTKKGFLQSVVALDVSVGKNEQDFSDIGKGSDPIVVSGDRSPEEEKKVVIKTDAIPSPPTPPPPRRSH